MPKKVVKQANPKRFIGVLVVIALVGIATLVYQCSGGAEKPITVDPTIPAGAAEGYLMGRADAPVQILEFGDFECPGCGYFATITEPDLRTRLIGPGIVAFRFFDFPLESHRNTWPAHMAASCADEQGRFWEMHDRLYAGQDQWNGEATKTPLRVFRRYASDLGLDVAKWETCVTTQARTARIKGNQAEGMRRNVRVTPTLIIGDQQVSIVAYDEIKRLVDTVLAARARDSVAKGAKGSPAKGVKGAAAKQGSATPRP